MDDAHPLVFRVEQALASYGLIGRVTCVQEGPTLYRVEYQPLPGTKVSKFSSMGPNLSLALGVANVKLEVPLPGKNAIGIEIPKTERDVVPLVQVLGSEAYRATKNPLALGLGVDMEGKPLVAELDKLPHLLIAGTTGCIHGDTLIYDPVDQSEKKVSQRYKEGKGFHVWSKDTKGDVVITAALPPVKYPKTGIVKVTLSNGRTIRVTPLHRFLTRSGWRTASWICERLQIEPVTLPSSSSSYLSAHASNALHWSKTSPGSLVDYRQVFRSCDGQPPSGLDTGPIPPPSLTDAPEHNHSCLHEDGDSFLSTHTHAYPRSFPVSKSNSYPLENHDPETQPLPPVGIEQRNDDSHATFSLSEDPTALIDTGIPPRLLAPESTGDTEQAIHSCDDGFVSSLLSLDTSASCPSPTCQTSNPDPVQQSDPGSDLVSFDVETGESIHFLSSREKRPAQHQSPQSCNPTDTSADPIPSWPSNTSCNKEQYQHIEDVVQVVKIEDAGIDYYYDFHVPLYQNYWCGDVFHHNSGKSCLVNSILCSLIHRHPREQVGLLLIDPKGTELSPYEGAPHVMKQVFKDPMQSCMALHAMVQTMNERYELMYRAKTKDFDVLRMAAKDTQWPDPYWLSRLVIVVDEVADLMLTMKKAVETPLVQLAQKARACGIHLVLATQRPTVNVITGLLKANIPARIALQTASAIDSRVILDANGAERLLGRGDAYFRLGSQLTRFQSCLVRDDEVRDLVEFSKRDYQLNGPVRMPGESWT